MSSATRPPYAGPCLKLVVAFDIGTTYSGASYSLLEPGQPPIIQGVTRCDFRYSFTVMFVLIPDQRYPARAHVGGDCKIPSILYYDINGDVKAAGAEALQENTIQKAEVEEWRKVEWYQQCFSAQRRC